MNRPITHESRCGPLAVAPSPALHVQRVRRRRPRRWTRAQQQRFLFHLATEDTLAGALNAVAATRAEANAERLRCKTFARAWDRCIATRIARLPELMLDTVQVGLNGGQTAGEAAVRNACSVGKWLVEHVLPALTSASSADAPARADLGMPAARPAESPAPAALVDEILDTVAAKLAGIESRPLGGGR